MYCNCIKDFEEKYTEAATKQLKVEAKAKVQGIVYQVVDNTIKLALSVPLKITADATGYRRGKEQKLIATYCPFCGTKAFNDMEKK